MPRIHHENQYGGGNRSQERAEKRYDIGNADDNAHQHRIWRIHQRGAQKAQYSDDDGIQDLAADKSDKGLMGKTEVVDHHIGRILFKSRIGNLLGLACKFFLAGQYIDGYDKTYDEVP